MMAIKLNGEWRLEDLRRFVEPVEIYDCHERLIGLFVPANLERGKTLHAQGIAAIDRAEVERRAAQETGGRPLRETVDRMTAFQQQLEGNGVRSGTELTE